MFAAISNPFTLIIMDSGYIIFYMNRTCIHKTGYTASRCLNVGRCSSLFFLRKAFSISNLKRRRCASISSAFFSTYYPFFPSRVSTSTLHRGRVGLGPKVASDFRKILENLGIIFFTRIKTRRFWRQCNRVAFRRVRNLTRRRVLVSTIE